MGTDTCYLAALGVKIKGFFVKKENNSILGLLEGACVRWAMALYFFEREMFPR